MTPEPIELFIRVADLKTRSRRFDRIRVEMGLADNNVLRLTEFMHPRAEEIVGMMPARLGARLEADPRWMALHKIWLSTKPQRNALEKPKDLRQGNVLLSACRYFLADAYPLDIDFVLELPAELRELFNEWAHASGFDHLNPN